METNKSLISETIILINARRYVIISFIILLSWLFIYPYFFRQNLNFANYSSIYLLFLWIHAFLCGRLHNIMFKKTLGAVGIGFAIVVLGWFAMGIGMIVLTTYLLVKSSNILKIEEEK